MNNSDAIIIYNALKDIIMNVFKENIDIAKLSEEVQPIGEEVNYIGNSINELNIFAQDISQGVLNGPAPSRANYLIGHLKEMRSALSHLTWQAQQVTKGDYNQRVDFLGDFSIAFNTMIEQLELREKRLMEEIKKNKLIADQTKSTNELLYGILDSINNWVIVTATDNSEVLYINRAAKEYFDKMKKEKFKENVITQIKNIFSKNPDKHWQFKHNFNTYSFDSYEMDWSGRHAFVHLIFDVTDKIKKDKIMKEMAYHDTLTGLYNRWYGLEQLNKLISERIDFCVCFIDIDRLKYVNDNFGHNEGDVYIRFVADKLREFFRGDDVICRMGGDEFLVLLADVPYDFVLERTEKLYNSIKDISDKHEKQYVLSISYGVIKVNKDDNVTIESVLDEADSRMYSFKKKMRMERV